MCVNAAGSPGRFRSPSSSTSLWRAVICRQVGQEHHAHVLSVVDDAVTDLVMASKDLNVIAYTKKSCVPLEQVDTYNSKSTTCKKSVTT
jgi:hypothetical protein